MMRRHRDPFETTPDERAADLLDAFELEEVHARRWMRVPGWIRTAVTSGTIPAHMGVFHRRTHRRLAFRRFYAHGHYIVMRHVETGRVLRLPFA